MRLYSCYMCKRTKPYEEFYKNKRRSAGISSSCKECAKLTVKQWRERNGERTREWRRNRLIRRNEINLLYYYKNKDKINLQRRMKYSENNEQIKAELKRYYIHNRDRVCAASRKYAKNNRKKINEYVLNRKRDIPTLRLKHAISNAVRKSLRGSKSRSSWQLIVGYNLIDLKRHLELKFRDGMTWENYGKLWHIDHVIPVSWWVFNSPYDIGFKMCWNLNNLQPLLADENFRKGARLEL